MRVEKNVAVFAIAPLNYVMSTTPRLTQGCLFLPASGLSKNHKPHIVQRDFHQRVRLFIDQSASFYGSKCGFIAASTTEGSERRW